MMRIDAQADDAAKAERPRRLSTPANSRSQFDEIDSCLPLSVAVLKTELGLVTIADTRKRRVLSLSRRGKNFQSIQLFKRQFGGNSRRMALQNQRI